MPNLTLKQLTLVFVSALIIGGLVLVGLNFIVNKEITNVETKWNNLKSFQSERVVFLEKIRADLGFGVVAHEIKGLSQQTSDATDRIIEHVRAMQKVSSDAIASIEEIKHIISPSIQDDTVAAQQTGSPATEVLDVSTNLTNQSNTLSEKVVSFVDRLPTAS